MDQQILDEGISAAEADELVSHIDALELEITSLKDALAASKETIEMQRLSVSQKTVDQETKQNENDKSKVGGGGETKKERKTRT